MTMERRMMTPAKQNERQQQWGSAEIINSPEPGGTHSENENSLLTPFGLLATRALNFTLGMVTEST